MKKFADLLTEIRYHDWTDKNFVYYKLGTIANELETDFGWKVLDPGAFTIPNANSVDRDNVGKKRLEMLTEIEPMYVVLSADVHFPDMFFMFFGICEQWHHFPSVHTGTMKKRFAFPRSIKSVEVAAEFIRNKVLEAKDEFFRYIVKDDPSNIQFIPDPPREIQELALSLDKMVILLPKANFDEDLKEKYNYIKNLKKTGLFR